uniref:Tyrosine-protein kinase n=1 Tax=Ciona intestinalis TaxID=7719 RepID=F6QTW3_CIOIN
MAGQLYDEVYYHGPISRSEATELVKGQVDGSFLLRKSLREPDGYAISVSYQGSVLHYSIQHSTVSGWYSVNKGSEHPSPQALCKYYMQEKGGLKTKLLWPIKVASSPPPQTPPHSPQYQQPLPPLPQVRPGRSGSTVSYEEQEWYHGEITRQEDAVRLSHSYRELNKNGIYLIRFKENGVFVLSVVNDKKVHRYKILQNTSNLKYSINGKPPEFLSLEQLIQFHEEQPPEISHLHCRLTLPCKRSTSASVIPQNCFKHLVSQQQRTNSHNASSKRLSGFASALAAEFKSLLPANGLDENPVSQRPQSSLNGKVGKPVMDRFSRSSLPKDSIGYKSPYMNFSDKSSLAPDLYITTDKLIIRGDIGKGHFGAVKVGECKIMGSFVPCAVKNLTGSDIETNKNDLLKEAKLMQQFDHPYIVRLLAICDAMESSGSLMLVMELAPLGSLKDFLSQHNEKSFPEERLLVLMNQVCDGMAYLSGKNIVHRDLAARNILLVTENFAKISDFGMSRIFLESDNYYKASQPGTWPLRWYAPEALLYYKFTSKGEIWSFGVTLWEVFSYGSRPYSGLKGREILAMLEGGKRLECPCGCSPGVYTIMLQCWAYDPEDRPTFNDLLLQFKVFIVFVVR